MNRTGLACTPIVWLAPLLLFAATGCQTVRTPEEKIAASNIPTELDKASLPEYVIEPPDLLVVEVLEALAGRPITGERLVRPDGTISLDFYGKVYVSGLKITEAKEKVILHLRKFLSDEQLGLVEEDPETGEMIPIPPAESKSVFVDVTSYNSKVYYVQGDVAAPGRMPITGNETVLDAINYAGGLTPTASHVNIQLVRPAPPGSACEQKLPVNYAAIIYGGDPTTNYQLLPGDRLVVNRDPIVRTTLFIDRLAAPFNSVVSSIMTFSFTGQSLRYLNTPLTTANRTIVTNGTAATTLGGNAASR